jgi:hypothetical protein
MQPAPADQLIEAIIRMQRSAALEEARARRRARLPAWLRRERPKTAFTAQPPQSRSGRRSDVTITLLGITLGLICALFPWYIFLNPDKFGPPAIRLGGDVQGTPGAVGLAPQAERVGAPSLAEPPSIALDLLATGTTGRPDEDAAARREQPFPPSPTPFQILHIANGRAMIQDDSGIFLVQRGSVLPDLSKVASIELRAGRWVVVTEGGETLAAE